LFNTTEVIEFNVQREVPVSLSSNSIDWWYLPILYYCILWYPKILYRWE